VHAAAEFANQLLVVRETRAGWQCNAQWRALGSGHSLLVHGTGVDALDVRQA